MPPRAGNACQQSRGSLCGVRLIDVPIETDRSRREHFTAIQVEGILTIVSGSEGAMRPHEHEGSEGGVVERFVSAQAQNA